MLDIGHPKDVNVFKNIIKALQSRGHEVKIVARKKENTTRILDELGFQYVVAPYYKNIIGKVLGIITNDLYIYKIAKKFKPDIFISPGSPYSAHISKIIGKPHIAFSDTEIANLLIKIMLPFTDKICTSTSFYLDLGPKQERFNGYNELAYLHPKYFVPNKEVLKKYGLYGNYIIFRLSSLSSHHDLRANGFSFKTESELKDYIIKLEVFGRVIIFSDDSYWKIIKEHEIKIDPKDLHDIISFAKLYIGEGATMASEAAILGIPSIYVSNTRRGYLDELEKKYDLAYTIQDGKEAINKAVSLLEDNNSTEKWNFKKEKMLKEKIDVVEFMVKIIENNAS